MTARNELEYNKFGLEGGVAKLIAVEGVSPATAILNKDRRELENNKFTPSGEVRIITSF